MLAGLLARWPARCRMLAVGCSLEALGFLSEFLVLILAIIDIFLPTCNRWHIVTTMH